jgi:hypothetical protein
MRCDEGVGFQLCAVRWGRRLSVVFVWCGRQREGTHEFDECVVCGVVGCGAEGDGAIAVSAWCGGAVPEGAERVR